MPNQIEETILFENEVTDESGSLFSYTLLKRDDHLCIRLSQKLNISSWEVSFSLKSLSEANKNWYYFNDDAELQENIINSVKDKLYSLKKNIDNSYNFVIKVLKKEFIISIDEIKGDINKNFDQFIGCFKALEGKIVKIEDKINTFDNIVEKFDKFIENFEIKWKNIEDKLTHNEERIIKIQSNIFYDFSFYTGNSNGNLKFSNNDKTIEKVSAETKWCGCRCDPPYKILDNKLAFSIKIENLAQNSVCNIFLGYCLKTADHSKGYYQTTPSYVIGLYQGLFYKSSILSGAFKFFKGNPNATKDQIYTAIIDIKEKRMWILLNGNSFGAPCSLDLKDEEIATLCPFIDIVTQGDKFTIVDNPPLK